MGRPFLRADWKNLVMVNYRVSPEVLAPYLPHKTFLDEFDGHVYVSLVGFLFANTRVLGIRVPYHVTFEEVNLRFYVKHGTGESEKRGVVFIKEIVPRAAIRFIANTLYGEKYCSMPMSSSCTHEKELTVSYKWRYQRSWNSLEVAADIDALPIIAGSEEEFIAEHYYGYSRIGPLKTFEYKVEHPRWKVYPVKKYSIDCEFGKLYGTSFAFLQNAIPSSVFLAQGSGITVSGKRLL